MGVEKDETKSEGRYVGGFFQLFDWTSKSRKKLFATKSDLPESSKQRRKIDGKLAMKQTCLVDEDEIVVGPSIGGSGEHSYASSVTDDEVWRTRAPGLVAKLMGLDNFPSSNFPDPYSTPYFDTQSLGEAQYWRTNLNYQREHRIQYSGKLLDKAEGSSRNLIDPKPQEILSKPIDKFQTEVMPPKSAKSIPATHHKLLSPIKSPGFVPANNAAYIMEAAARIIEPGPQVITKAKTPLVASLRFRDLKEKVEASQKEPLIGSSSLTSRVRDLKEKRENSRRTGRYSETSQRSVESSAAKYLKGQCLNKSCNGCVNTPLRSTSEAETYSSFKSKGKSISLAIQAKVNVQRREGLSSSGGRSLVDQKGHFDCKTNLLPKDNVQKSMHRKSSYQNASAVLRQNNLKQNCSIDKDKLPSKSLVSNSNIRKVQTWDSSCGRHRSSSSKSIGKSKVGLKKSAMQVTDSEKEVLYTRTNNFPRKKRNTDRDWNDRVVDNLFVDKTQRLAQSNLVIEKYHSWAEEVKQKDMDVVSFTFTTPLTKYNYGFEAPGQAGLKSNEPRVDMLLDTDNTRSSAGYNEIGGDALGILLEQKLRELTYGVENSCHNSFKVRPPSPKSKDPVPVNSVNCIPRLQQEKDQDVLFTDSSSSSSKSDNSSSGLPELSSKHRLRVDEMEERKSNPMEAKLSNGRQPSPISVLEPSFSTENYESSISSDAASAEGSKFCSSAQAQEVVGLNFSRKFYPVEADTELTDSACSTSTGTMLKKHTSTWELDYMNDILCNVELMYMDFALGRARDVVNPHLFNQLEGRKRGGESGGGESRIRRKVIFDCVSECLDLKCRRYVGGGYKMWAKGIAMVRKNEWLAGEVYKEVSSWEGVGIPW